MNGSGPTNMSTIIRAAGLPGALLVALLVQHVQRAEEFSTALGECALSLGVFGVGVWWLRSLPLLRRANRWPTVQTLGSTGLLIIAIAVDAWIGIAISWSLLAHASIQRHLDRAAMSAARPYWPILLFIVPWVWADGWWLGYTMRITGAAGAAEILSCFMPTVARQGTTVAVGDVGLDVAAACAGLNTIQVFLLIGTLVTAYSQRSLRLTMLAIPAMLALAWITNTTRIVGLGLVAATAGASWATGTTHDAIGWVLLAGIGFVALRFIPQRPHLGAAG